MKIFTFVVMMTLITSAAFASHEITVGILALGLLMLGVFIYQFQDHPAVQEWLERYF
jgi:hypothetical protein